MLDLVIWIMRIPIMRTLISLLRLLQNSYRNIHISRVKDNDFGGFISIIFTVMPLIDHFYYRVSSLHLKRISSFTNDGQMSAK